MTHTFFHTTLACNKDSILTNGLVPAIGERSAELGEPIERVYLFNSEEDLDSALGSWLGDCFEEDDILATFKVILDLDTPGLKYDPEFYESYSDLVVKPECISYFKED